MMVRIRKISPPQSVSVPSNELYYRSADHFPVSSFSILSN